MKKPAVMILVVFLLFSCDLSTIPNPIIGTYVLRESGTSSFYSATFSFDSDGTFIYSEVVEEEMEVVMEGTYTYSLSFFDFERANGNIGITLFFIFILHYILVLFSLYKYPPKFLIYQCAL